MNKKEKLKMSQIESKLLTIITQLHEVLAELPKSPQNTPGNEIPVSQPSAPIKPATPQAAPKEGVSAEVSALTAKAVAEAGKLTGPRVGELFAMVADIQTSKTVEEVQSNTLAAIRFSQFLGPDLGVDVSALEPILNDILKEAGDSRENVVIGDADRPLDVTN